MENKSRALCGEQVLEFEELGERAEKPWMSQLRDVAAKGVLYIRASRIRSFYLSVPAHEQGRLPGPKLPGDLSNSLPLPWPPPSSRCRAS